MVENSEFRVLDEIVLIILQKGKNRFWCKYCQRLFFISIFCVINNMLVGFVHFLSTEFFTKVLVHPEVGYGLYTYNSQRMKAINQTV